jgi:hypothetical protein
MKKSSDTYASAGTETLNLPIKLIKLSLENFLTSWFDYSVEMWQ